MKKKTFLVLILVLICVYSVNSQGPGPGGPPVPPPPGLPVDGGLLFLFVSGLIYGVKKVKK